MHQNKHKHHIPVLLHEVLSVLSPEDGESYLDVTAGYGGHAGEILSLTNAYDKATLVDRDENAIGVLKDRFNDTVAYMHDDYLSASKKLKEQGNTYDLVLADIGVSSPHLNDAQRGFSLKVDGPLDMRMDVRQDITAATVVNTYSKERLAKILRDYGEEPKATRITEAIIAARPLQTTLQLAQIVATVWKGYSKVHPATRTFQALRIEVNSELDQLRSALPLWVNLLNPGGRLAVISFHSLEDRIVKQYFAKHSGNRFDATLQLLTKKPVTASDTEIVSNPRSRSAKLRGVVKIKRKG